MRKPALGAPEDISVYELYVRDFSASDPLVPEALRGTFKAFTLRDTHRHHRRAAICLGESGRSVTLRAGQH